MAFDLYQTVTDKILAMLDKGVAPWRSPIMASANGRPMNLASDKAYRGVNVFLLAYTAMERGYTSRYWVTFPQALELGGNVRKGEKSSMVVFWKLLEDKKDKSRKIPLLRYYNVFNLDQCDGIKAPDAIAPVAGSATPIESADDLVNGYLGAPVIANDGGARAYYKPADDSVHMPAREVMRSAEEYYSTLFHELAHSTGHSSRLNRGLDVNPVCFGDENYGREELVAELAASFLGARAGIEPATIENNAAYLAGWARTLRGDKKLVVAAAGAAQKAADWIVGERGEA